MKIDKIGALKTQKTQNSGKIAGEEKCMKETEDVKERQKMIGLRGIRKSFKLL